MAGYKPTYIQGMKTGLVQERQEFILPDDAYPILENAFVWRERIKRKKGYEILGRLRRIYTDASIGVSGASPWSFNLYSTVVPPIDVTITGEPDASIEAGSLVITIGVIVFTDQGDGTLTSPTPGNSGTVNYITGDVVLTHTAGAGVASIATFAYFPGLPVMGLRTRELASISNEMLIAFDMIYAYNFVSGGWKEFIPGTTWSGTDSNFFWSTNYWVSPNNVKLFWVTNFSGPTGDPIRFTNGIAWADFDPIINAAGDRLNQCLALLPFRGRLLAFNTFEGANLAASVQYRQRIRWSAIGNPITETDINIFPLPANVSADAWRDDIRGKGGFLDIPTAEDIISVGFVRDNLVIYCENSTWQLRYTGRSIQPFQIEKVNTELGAESTFSVVQFDTSLMGIGDKGVVECDSYKSELIDIKIPDLVFQFNNSNEGVKRVHGIRDFIQRLAYWTYPINPASGQDVTFPNRRLVYNYENDSWAIFTDSLTTLGTFQSSSGRTWLSEKVSWAMANFPWINRPALIPDIVGGNQQGYVLYLDSQVSNDESLFIQDIQGNDPLPTVITSPNHNMEPGTVISILGIPTGTPFDDLNGMKFGIFPGDNAGSDRDNKFRLYTYNPADGDFTVPRADPSGTYVGGGQIAIRDGFYIESKKFNFADQGQSIQLGYIDILMDATDEGAISLNVLLNYNESAPVNLTPENVIQVTNSPDTFFNSVVPTTNASIPNITGTKYLHRVFCPVRGNYITIIWTLSNAQLVGIEQESEVQIDNQTLWMRPAGRMTNI